MEMIYHVHLTKTDFENIKHLWLTRAAFRHLLLLSPENIHILKNDEGGWRLIWKLHRWKQVGVRGLVKRQMYAHLGEINKEKQRVSQSLVNEEEKSPFPRHILGCQRIIYLKNNYALVEAYVIPSCLAWH